MDKLINLFENNWGVIIDAPLGFIIIGLVCGSIGFSVAKWHYQERISVLKQAELKP